MLLQMNIFSFLPSLQKEKNNLHSVSIKKMLLETF